MKSFFIGKKKNNNVWFKTQNRIYMKIIFILLLLFSEHGISQKMSEIKQHSRLFKDTSNICTKSRVEAALYITDSINLVGSKKRRIIKLFGKGENLTYVYNDFCSEEHDEQWYYTLWSICDENGKKDYLTETYMKIYFKDNRVVCLAII